MSKRIVAVLAGYCCIAASANGGPRAIPEPLSIESRRSAAELSQLVTATKILPKVGLVLVDDDAKAKDRSKCVIVLPPPGGTRPFCAIAESSPTIRNTDGSNEINCVAEIEAGQILLHPKSVKLVLHWVNLETKLEGTSETEIQANPVTGRSYKTSFVTGRGGSGIELQPHSYTAVVLVRDSDEDCWKAISSKSGIVRPTSTKAKSARD